MASEYDIKAQKKRDEAFIADSAAGYQKGEQWNQKDREWFRGKFGDDAYRKVFLPDVSSGAGGYVEAAINKGAQGVTFGLADEIKALATAAGSPGNASAKAQAYRGELQRERNKGSDISALYPATSGLSDIAGSLATGLISGGVKTGARMLGKAGIAAAESVPTELSALQKALAATLDTLKAGAKGVPQGAVSGVGYSDADFTKGEGLGSAIGGGIIGGGVSAIGAPLFGKAVTAAAKTPESVPVSLLSAISGAPKEAIREYAVRGKELRGAQTFEQLNPEVRRIVEDVLDRGIYSSQLGAKELAEKRKRLTTKDFVEMLTPVKAKIEQGASADTADKVWEDVGDKIGKEFSKWRNRPGSAGPVASVQNAPGSVVPLGNRDIGEYLGPLGTGPEMSSIPLERLKMLIQDFDQSAKWGTSQGVPVGKTAQGFRSVRDALNQRAREESPEYATLTDIAAKNLSAVEPFRASLKNDDTIGSLIRQISKGKKKAELETLDMFTDTPIAQKIKDAATKEMMEKPTIQGSRRVVMGGNLGEAIGKKIGVGGVDLALPGKAVGSAIGYGMDVAGRPLAAMSAEMAGDISRMIGIDPRKMGEYAKMLGDAAASGPSQLAITNAIMYAKEPQYRRLVDDQTKAKK